MIGKARLSINYVNAGSVDMLKNKFYKYLRRAGYP